MALDIMQSEQKPGSALQQPGVSERHVLTTAGPLPEALGMACIEARRVARWAQERYGILISGAACGVAEANHHQH